MSFHIDIQTEDFDVGREYQSLIDGNMSDGACVFFVGMVRDINNEKSVTHLELEHYSGMAEKSLSNICEKTMEKFDIGRIRVIHRVGRLSINDQIVFVGVTSMHREESFQAATFIMDFLKQDVPIWKKEYNGEKSEWVEPNAKEQRNIKQWT